MLKTILASQSDCSRWDEFVRSAEDSTLYHLFYWRMVIEETYKLKPYYFMAADNKENIQGVLPVFETRTITEGKGACSLPFCNYGGICARSQEARELLLNAARKRTDGRP